jgi:hypothetical protein
MNFDEMFPSNYLSCPDVRRAGGVIVDTILGVEMAEMQDGDRGKKPKPIICLKANKPMVLNRTNGNFLRERLGDRTEAWHGAKVAIGVERVPFGREMIDGLRFKNARPASPPGNSPPPSPTNPRVPPTKPGPERRLDELADDALPVKSSSDLDGFDDDV